MDQAQRRSRPESLSRSGAVRRPDARRAGQPLTVRGSTAYGPSTAAFAAATTWYRQPLNLFGRLEIDGFDVSGVAPLACGMFAFAVATTAGALLRRSLPAMGSALVAFVAVRACVAVWLRPNYRAPITVVEEITAGTDLASVELFTVRDWTLTTGTPTPPATI